MLAIAVDRHNTLWFGTKGGGVSHYTPGSGWESFTTDSTNNGLPDNYVQAIAVGPDNTLWFGTQNGVSRYTPEDGWQSFTTNSTDNGLADNFVNAIAIDANNTLWFGTGGGVSRYISNTNQWQTFTTDDGLADNDVQAIAVDTDNSLWFGTWGGVSHYTYTPEDEWVSFTEDDGLGSNFVGAIAVGADNYLWFGTNGGVNHYRPEDGWQSFITTGLVHNHVQAIAVDADNPLSVWFGTFGGGVSHYTQEEGWQHFTTDDGLAHNEVTAIAVGADNTLWVGTWGGGVSRYTPNTNQWQTFTTDNGLVSNDVRAIAYGTDNSLWVGTRGGVSHYMPSTNQWESFTTNDGLANNEVWAIAVDANNSLWVGTEGGVSHYTPRTNQWQTLTRNDGLGDNEVRAIAVDADNSLWFGTWGGGVSHYTPDTNEWKTLTTNDGLADNFVRVIAVGVDNSLWFATWSGGVSHYMPDINQWESFTEDDRLIDKFVRAIAVGANNSLWIGTDNGMSHWIAPTLQSDLSIQLSAPARVLPNRPVTYALQIENHGQLTADDPRLTLTLPMTLTYLESSLPPVSTAPLIWQLESLPANSSPMQIVVTATLPAEALPGSHIAATADMASSTPESFLSNNSAQVRSLVVDPYRADVSVSLIGPPLLVPGTEAEFKIWRNNSGGLPATNTQLIIDLPLGLSYESATLVPTTTVEPLVWELGTLSALSSILPITLTLQVDDNVPENSQLTLSATITTTSPESNLSNNAAASTVSTSLADAKTLILVAPDRLTDDYGTSPLLSRLYDIANHSLVRGVILDIERDPDVQAAYAAWDADPGSWQKANGVAEAIKALIEQYTISSPNLEYLLFVGSDEMIPFYRVADQSSTMWSEPGYANYLPPGTVRAALSANRLLTDDFYADRSPTIPDSPFWYDEHPLYVPDLASGRLVESPDEIMAAIDAFLANDGVIALESGFVGVEDDLTNDWGEMQYEALQTDGLAATYSENYQDFRERLLNDSFDSIWTGRHSNHLSMGGLYSWEILAREQAYSQSLIFTIGCHAGLNVPEQRGDNRSYDLPQAFLSRGGTYIASSSYGYAGIFGTSYSEELAEYFTDELLTGPEQLLGQALVRAKQRYYTSPGGFGYLHEKVMLPVTLYGLPMLQITTPNSAQRLNKSVESVERPSNLKIEMTTSRGLESLSIVSYTLSHPTYTLHEVDEGQYYEVEGAEGEIFAEYGYPIQPFLQVPLTNHPENQTPHGVIVRHVTYTEQLSFNPVIPSVKILSEKEAPQTEPMITIEGWDWSRPYSLNLFDGLLETTANLNLILGAYDSAREVERLYESLTLEVLYSESLSRTAPTIDFVTGYEVAGVTHLQVKASTDSEAPEAHHIAAVVAVCDNGQGEWLSADLLYHDDHEQWEGVCDTSGPFYVQVVDNAGNVAVSEWQELQPKRIEGTVALEGRPTAPDASYQIPLTITLTGPQHYTFNTVTDPYGRFALIGHVEPGHYTMTLKSRHTLRVSQTVEVVDGLNTFNLPALPEGDANNDNFVTLADFSILAASFGKCEAMSGFDQQADFNEDTCVTLTDFSLLAENFGQGGTSTP